MPHHRKSEGAVYSSPEDKLHEKFERSLGNHAANPVSILDRAYDWTVFQR